MLARIALFELRYQLRRPISWISFAVFALLAFGLVTLSGLVAAPVPLNAPSRIALTVAQFALFGMFLSIATIADVALRDTNTRMDAILRVQPIRTSAHFGPRFAGAFLVAALAFLGVSLGYVVGAAMPWVTAQAAGPLLPQAHLVAIVVMALPTMFATGVLFFSIAAFTGRLMATYLGALVLLAALVGASFLMRNPEYQTVAALLDPFGMLALIQDTATSGRLDQAVRLDGLLMWNRLVWSGIAGALLILSFTALRGRERRPRAARVDVPVASTRALVLDRPVITPGGVGVLEQLALRTRYETSSILRSWTFLVMLILGVVLAAVVLFVLSQSDVANLNSTPVVANAIAAAFVLVTVLLPIAYSGELIWRDRSARIDQIIDTTIAPNMVFLVSKIVALAVVIIALVVVAMTSGILFQLVLGQSIGIGLYLIKLGLFVGLPALMYGVLAIFVQTVVNSRFVGLLIMLALLGVVGFAPEFGVRSDLLLLFTLPDPGMTGDYGAYVRPLWFAGYWSCAAVLVGWLAHLLWPRGTGSLWLRIKAAPRSIAPASAAVGGFALAGMIALAVYLS